MKPKFLLLPLFAACLAFTACNYDSPLTTKPTRRVDERLLGDWVAVDKDSQKEELMHVRQLDDSNYVAAFDHDIYRAFHSDFADMAFLTVQDLNSSDRLYLYMAWEVSADGRQLKLRTVSDKIVTGKNKGQAALQKALQENLRNPSLLNEVLVFNRSARRKN
ncbi:MAG: hypothetical protein PSU94_14205 [Lacunisphaera sp.]|nr:hypothetical protein [Lacunisphaera sp.]